MSDVQVGEEPIRKVPVRSQRFLCGVCGDRLTENQTFLSKRYKDNFYAEQKRKRAEGKAPMTMKVKLECPRGCHRAPWFTICDVTCPSRKFKP